MELTDEQIAEAKKKLARRRRRLRGGAKRKLKKAAKYARYRVEDCRIARGWDVEQMANIVQLRPTPAGTYIFAGLLVDLACLGIKDALFETDVDQKSAEKLMYDADFEQDQCSPHLAAKIAQTGAVLSTHLGFSIPADGFAILQLFNRFDPDRAEEEIPLGRDGQPFFVPGIDDDVDAILEHLEERLGPDGFDYMIPWDE